MTKLLITLMAKLLLLGLGVYLAVVVLLPIAVILIGLSALAAAYYLFKSSSEEKKQVKDTYDVIKNFIENRKNVSLVVVRSPQSATKTEPKKRHLTIVPDPG
ncbi:MAG: hypothetical protein CMP10_09245 [Zetaproteobacteria bacterium]|nr:hypothetical protein [Pseudobdellovibrionaceae bacterium]